MLEVPAPWGMVGTDRVGEGYFQILKRRKTEDLQEICTSPGAGDLIIFVV